MPSIGPKKGWFEEKKIFDFRNFSPPKWAKTSFLGPSRRGPKGIFASGSRPKFFGEWCLIGPWTTYKKFLLPFFRILEKIHFSWFSPNHLFSYEMCSHCVSSLVLWAQASSGCIKSHLGLVRSQIEPVANHLHTLESVKSTRNWVIFLPKDLLAKWWDQASSGCL